MLLVSFCCIPLSAQTASTSGTDKDNLPYRLSFTFRVNTATLDLDYLDNRSQLESLDSLMASLSADDIDSLVVSTTSSPEGPLSFNIKLANARDKAFMDFFRSRYPSFPESKIVITDVREAWDELADLAGKDESIDSAYAAKIREIVSSGLSEAEMGSRLEALPITRYLRYTIFPKLRRSELAFYQSIADDVQEEAEPEGEPEAGESVEAEPKVEAEPAPEHQVQPLVPVPAGRVHLIALRTNLAYDLFYMPRFGFAPMWDIQAEFYPLAGHWTYNIQFTSPYWHKWDEHKFFQIRDYRLEARRYFRGGASYTGFYTSAYAEATRFGIGLSDDDGWQGEGAGSGIQFGYVLPLSRKGNLRMEFSAGLGAFSARMDPYVYGNPVTGNKDGFYYYDYTGSADKFKKRNHRFTWFGPTSAGISLTYDVIYRKGKEAGR